MSRECVPDTEALMDGLLLLVQQEATQNQVGSPPSPSCLNQMYQTIHQRPVYQSTYYPLRHSILALYQHKHSDKARGNVL